MKWSEAAIIPMTAIFIASLVYFNREAPPPPLPVVIIPAETIPDFTAFSDISQKKQAFFEFMLPKVRAANIAVLTERARLERIHDRLSRGAALTKREKQDLAQLVDKYDDAGRPLNLKTVDALLLKVDAVPASLILAQAANESAWGTSRFARDANNYFGIWCFKPGCGLTPALRDEGATHQVARFDSVQDCANYYLLTINTNHAYRELRHIRAELREESTLVRGNELARGLVRYSERGMDYVQEIQAMIRVNRLHRFTRDTAAVTVSTD